MATRGPKMADGAWKAVYPSRQLSQNKFSDPNTPAMRKGCDRENMDVQEGYMMKKIMMILAATNIIASRPPER